MRILPVEPVARAAVLWAAGWCALVWLAFRARPAEAVWPREGLPPAPSPPATDVPTAPPIVQWWKLEGDDVELATGVRYRGCVKLPWYAPTSVVRSKLRPGLEEKGFHDVVVTEMPGAAWPTVACDFYVEATWGRETSRLERPGAVAFAWRRG